MASTQSAFFLDSEGDAWYKRNKASSPDSIDVWQNNDLLLEMILNLPLAEGPQTKILEIGCGHGNRLDYIKRHKNWSVVGLDPSKQAIKSLNERGIDGIIGTAESLEFDNHTFDLIVYGFCLCWVDRTDLFSLIAEANRVTKPKAWIAIYDFWNPNQISNEYHHKEGIKTYKTRPEQMFSWHPSYLVTDHKLKICSDSNTFEKPDNWTAVTTLRKDDTFIETFSTSQFQ